MNVESLSIPELLNLLNTVKAAITTKQQEQVTEREAAKAELKTAHDRLTALIGPDDPQNPGLNTYTEIQKYDDAAIGSHVVLAIRQILIGAEMQARIMRDIVRAFVD